jgi:general stress protein 26
LQAGHFSQAILGGDMNESQMRDRIRELLVSQKLAVLATQKDEQPYNCLVAIAGTADLKDLLFSTSRSTRKYNELKHNPRVSVLIDNRSNMESDFDSAVAVTAIGRAREAQGVDRDNLANIYLEKHPNLVNFVDSPDNALIRITVEKYVISSFKDVWELYLD